MSSPILRIAKKLRNLRTDTELLSLQRSLTTVTSERRSTTTTTSRANLFARISPLGNPSISIVPVLNQWAQEVKKISHQELRNAIQTLRKHKRYSHALEVSEWMRNKQLRLLSSTDHATCLDLISKIRGIESAESYFNSLGVLRENAIVYGALLNSYVKRSLVDKSLSLMQKMKALGFANTFCYNVIMSLHKNTDRLDEVPRVLEEMKKDGFVPDKFSYRICINAHGLRSDFRSMEAALEEMETRVEPNIVKEWGTYAMVANFYVKAGDRENSLIHLKKCEELVGNNSIGYNYLISNHANLGNRDEVARLWGLQRVSCNKRQVNGDYINMLGSLVKLGEFEEAEKLLEEWDSCCHVHDFRVPNTLLIGYCQNGLTEKAESMLREIVARGKTPIPNSWAIVASGHVDEKNMEKAFECLKEAVAVRGENVGWRPKASLIVEILNWVTDTRGVEEVEAYLDLVQDVISGNKKIYEALIGACVRAGVEIDGIMDRMRSDGIDLDEEIILEILSSSKNTN